MKKTISILLAVIMMLSLSTASFAGSSEVEIDKEYTMTVDTYKTLLLNVPEDGVYKLSASIDNSTGDFNMAAISVEINEENVSNLFLCYLNTEEEVDFPIDVNILSNEDYFVAGKDANVTVVLENCQDYFEEEIPAPTVTFTITKVDNLPEIRMNGSYSFSGESAYFILKPTEDGIYNLNSTLPCDDVSVMDSDGNIEYSYFDSESSLDFSFIVEAGKLYCIYLACFDEDIAEFSFNVTDATKIAIEEIELSDFYVVSGSMDWNYPIIRPYGACYNFDELEVSVGNEKIATAEYDPEDGSIVVYGNRPGKTTLTVTEPVSGVSTTVEVKVVSKIADFFSNLFYNIAFRIMMLIDRILGGTIVF